MDGRDSFLTMARDKHFEFSSLRRAQYSTLCMLYELHNQGQDKFVYTCNHCKNHVETRFHCTVCDVSIRPNRFFFHFSSIRISSHLQRQLMILDSFSGFRFVYRLQGESRSRASNGEVGLGFGRGIAKRFETDQSTRGTQAIHSTMHPIVGSCLSLPGATVSSTFVHENETGCGAHKDLQTENQWRLPDLQTTHRFVLLSRKTLQRSQMFGAILSEYQAQAKTTTACSKVWKICTFFSLSPD